MFSVTNHRAEFTAGIRVATDDVKGADPAYGDEILRRKFGKLRVRA